MRIFVAGATGVIGSRVLPLLLAAGHDVTAIARSAQKTEALQRMGAATAQVDLFDGDAVANAVQRHDAVINLATHIPPSSRALIPGAWRATNDIRKHVPGNLAHGALRAGVKGMIQESFAPAYPDCGDRWIDETTPITPARYNRAVADAEEAVARFTAGGGAGVTLRFAYLYGPDSDFNQDMIRYVRRGWAPTPGSPNAYISSVSHDDAASAVVAALAVPPGTYNVCDDEPLTHREYFRVLAELLHEKMPRFAPPWTKWLLGSLGETLARSQRISNRKLRANGNWSPTLRSMREGWPTVVRQSAGDARKRS